MTSSAAEQQGRDERRPAPFVRIFGWANLAVMTVYIANAVLTFWFGFPGISALYGGGGDGSTTLALLQAGFYGAGLALVVYYVTRTHTRTLRHDSAVIADANALLIRAAFWAVFLIGLADTAVSFLRSEGLLEGLFGDQLAVDLSKSTFRGLWVHVPAMLIGVFLATRLRTLGFFWLSLLVVGAELLIVFSRFIFSYEQPFMADLVRFWYAALFLFASAYTLSEDGHVRVDVLYANFSARARGRVNAVGSVMLGMTLCWTILFVGMGSKTSIIVSPILVFETTQTGFGMYVKYFMAGFLGIFGVSMMLQFVSYLFESVADWRDEPGGRADHHASHVA